MMATATTTTNDDDDDGACAYTYQPERVDTSYCGLRGTVSNRGSEAGRQRAWRAVVVVRGREERFGCRPCS